MQITRNSSLDTSTGPSGPIETLRPGDRVVFEPGEDHWHGAAPNRFMTRIAMLDVGDQGNLATWAPPESRAYRALSVECADSAESIVAAQLPRSFSASSELESGSAV
jgi:hypothetical protein